MGHYKDTESTIKHSIYCICGKSGAGKTTLSKLFNTSSSAGTNPESIFPEIAKVSS